MAGDRLGRLGSGGGRAAAKTAASGRERRWRRRSDWLPAPRLSAILVLLATSGPLSAVAAGSGVVPGDVAVARFVQRAPDPVAGALAAFAYWVAVGPAIAGVAIALGVGLLAGGRPVAAALLLAAALVRTLNPTLKDLFDSPRPTPDLVRVSEQARGLGFPSGHAMGAMLLFGSMAALTYGDVGTPRVRRLVRIAALLVIAVVGFGRVYTGAHWPSDVLGGFGWGGTALLLLLRLGRVLGRKP